MPFRVPEGLRRERSEKGDQLFEAAQAAEGRGDLAGAAANLRLAIAFDRHNAEYKRAFGAVQARLAVARIEEILKSEQAAIETGTRRELARLCDEALLYNEDDIETVHLAARAWLAMDEFDKAIEYAKKAAAERPDSVTYVRTVAEVHLARGEKGHAVKMLEQALELDSGDLEARKLFERLKKAPRRGSANGGVQ
jgi:tetratricopeptide (TPR) repeat protein